MRFLAAGWQQFWFAPASPLNLGLCRLLFLSGMFFYYLPVDFSVWGTVTDAFWMPTFLFERLRWSPGSPETLMLLQVTWKLALALGAIGCCTRMSTLVVFGVGIYLIGLPHNFGKIHHSDALIVLFLGILAASRCGDACSVDAWRRGRPGEPIPSGEYHWPIRLAWVLFALVFFAAGVSKMRHAGWEWAASDNLAILLVQHHYHVANADPWTTWGLALAQVGWLCRLLAFHTLALELLFPLALLSRRARGLWVAQAFLLQIGIRALMGPDFGGFLLCYVFWIPWSALLRRAPVMGRANAGAPLRQAA